VAGGDLLVQLGLDRVEDAGDRQPVGLELVEDGRGDRRPGARPAPPRRGGWAAWRGLGRGRGSPDQHRGVVGELQEQLRLDAEEEHQRRADRDAGRQPGRLTGGRPRPLLGSSRNIIPAMRR
jgi:hypothetical protein